MTHVAEVGSEHRGQLEKLARRGTASVFGAGFSAIFGILLVVVVTNGFSPTVAGTLFAATSAFLILESVALLGTDTGLVRWMPAQIASGRPHDLPRTLVVAILPVVTFAIAIAQGYRPGTAELAGAGITVAALVGANLAGRGAVRAPARERRARRRRDGAPAHDAPSA